MEQRKGYMCIASLYIGGLHTYCHALSFSNMNFHALTLGSVWGLFWPLLKPMIFVDFSLLSFYPLPHLPQYHPPPGKKDLFILYWSSPHEFLFCEEMQCTWMNWAKSRTDFPFLQTICCFSNSMNFWENQMTGIKSMLDKTSESQVQLDYWQVGLITVGYYEWTNADFISFRFTKISPLWQKYEELLDTLLLNFPSFSK